MPDGQRNTADEPPWRQLVLAYTETLPDEKATTCSEFLRRVHAWFAGHGVPIERVLSANAWAYRK